MGHVHNGQVVYGRLQKRLDRFPIGAPPAAALYEILKRLFTEEEAEVGCRMPMRFAGLEEIARRTGKSPDDLCPILERMAGTCARAALRMEQRKERVLVPERAWERAVTMAIERGKFQNFLFDDFDRIDHAALRAVTRIVIGLPSVKKALLAGQVRSRFFKALAG
jgi:hypothetical protein